MHHNTIFFEFHLNHESNDISPFFFCGSYHPLMLVGEAPKLEAMYRKWALRGGGTVPIPFILLSERCR